MECSRVMKFSSLGSPHPPCFLSRATLFCKNSPELMSIRPSFRVSCKLEIPDDRKTSSQFSSQISNPSIETETFKLEVGSSCIPANIITAPRLSFGSQALLLVCCTASLAFTSLVFAAVPTLFAMRKAAISMSKLADTAREEIPSTMAALRLSGMEISDLTVELTDLSREITDTASKSAQAVEAAEAGIRQIGYVARQKTMSMIQERANLPIISLQPLVAGAAKKTSRAVGRATKTFLNIISRSDDASVGEENGNASDGSR